MRPFLVLIPKETLTLDNDKMRQVPRNLLSNACKYSPTNERVVLATSEREKEREYAVWCQHH